MQRVTKFIQFLRGGIEIRNENLTVEEHHIMRDMTN